MGVGVGSKVVYVPPSVTVLHVLDTSILFWLSSLQTWPFLKALLKAPRVVTPNSWQTHYEVPWSARPEQSWI